jgi:hypothetical protein
MTRLNITDKVLDKLGFSEYWDEHGTWGGRTLTFSNGVMFRIIEQEEMDDDTEGYSSNGRYVAAHFYFADWFAIPQIDKGHFDLFFLHEMYDCIEKCYPDCLQEFVLKCNSLKMGAYIDEHIKNKSNDKI